MDKRKNLFSRKLDRFMRKHKKVFFYINLAWMGFAIFLFFLLRITDKINQDYLVLVCGIGLLLAFLLRDRPSSPDEPD